MTEQKVSDADERLIKANVELCLKCDQLTDKNEKLQRSLSIATTYNDYICALAQKISTESKVTKLRAVS